MSPATFPDAVDLVANQGWVKIAAVASSSENDLMRIQYSPACYDDELTMMMAQSENNIVMTMIEWEALDCFDDDDDGSDSDGDNDQVAKVTIA